MKELYHKIRSTFINGIILFLPVFILFAIVKEFYSFMNGSGHKITALLGLNREFAPLLTTLLVVLVFYLFGLLVRFSMITNAKNWIENNLLIYVPNYSKYKSKMMEKLLPGEDLRKPVLVKLNGAWKPGLLVNQDNNKSTVFMPSSPDTDYGEVWVVESSGLKELKMSTKAFKTSMLLGGKGLTTD
jgi:uncharacterized membrane protein